MPIEMNPVPYDIGDVAVVTGNFFVEGQPEDPTTLTCRVVRPDGMIDEVDLVRIDKGVYRGEYPITMKGTFYYRITGTGDAASSQERGFTVNERKVA